MPDKWTDTFQCFDTVGWAATGMASSLQKFGVGLLVVKI